MFWDKFRKLLGHFEIPCSSFGGTLGSLRGYPGGDMGIILGFFEGTLGVELGHFQGTMGTLWSYVWGYFVVSVGVTFRVL